MQRGVEVTEAAVQRAAVAVILDVEGVPFDQPAKVRIGVVEPTERDEHPRPVVQKLGSGGPGIGRREARARVVDPTADELQCVLEVSAVHFDQRDPVVGEDLEVGSLDWVRFGAGQSPAAVRPLQRLVVVSGGVKKRVCSTAIA